MRPTDTDLWEIVIHVRNESGCTLVKSVYYAQPRGEESADEVPHVLTAMYRTCKVHVFLMGAARVGKKTNNGHIKWEDPTPVTV